MSGFRRIRAKLGVPLAIGAVFAAPLVLALAVHGRPGWQPEGRSEHGELLHPLRALDAPALADVDGQPLADPWRGRWTLLYRSADGCTDECRGLMNMLWRICRAQADGQGRLQRVLALDVLPADKARVLRESDPGLRVTLTPGDWSLPAGSVYLVDPLGNLVLRYSPGFDPEGLAADLKRLLRVSRIG
jgi:hypothetical protein